MTPALQASALQVQLGARPVLSEVNVSVAAGRWTCIVGPNGAGKSTLLKALAGLLPMQGEVRLLGQPLGAATPRERAQRLAWMGQDEVVSDDLSVWDIAMLGRAPHQGWWGAVTVEDEQIVRSCLEILQVWDLRHRNLHSLSNGERQRVLLARLLAVQAEVMLMDEPLTNLDPPHQVDWLRQVRALVCQGRTVVSVLHEIGMALHADDVLVMRAGRVVHHGPCAEAATREAIEAVFDHRIRIGEVDGRWVSLPREEAG